MTESQLEATLRPIVARAVARLRTSIQPARVSTFSDASLDYSGDASNFSASDVSKLSDYFAADDGGCYPGHMHKTFGMGVKAFADAAGLRRKCVMSDGKPSWSWTGREKKEEPKTFADRPGLVLKEVSSGIHRWVKRRARDAPRDR